MRNRDDPLILCPCNHQYVIVTASKNLVDMTGEIFNQSQIYNNINGLKYL